MALRTGMMKPEDWERYLIEAGISANSAKVNAATFTNEKLTKENLQMLDRAMLKLLEVTSMRESLCIFKLAPRQSILRHRQPSFPRSILKWPHQQFRKFRIDWDVFAKITNMPRSQANIHLYNCADEALQNAIINIHPDFFTADPDKLLGMVEALVTQSSNPILHRFAFAYMSQSGNEPIQTYLVRLRTTVQDCYFLSFVWEWPLGYIQKGPIHQGHSKWRIPSRSTGQGWNVCYALRDQTSMASTPDIAITRKSTYRRQKSNTPQANTGNVRTSTYPNNEDSGAEPNRRVCISCTSHQHGILGTSSHQVKCPAWGQTWSNCGKPNHLSRVCRARNFDELLTTNRNIWWQRL